MEDDAMIRMMEPSTSSTDGNGYLHTGRTSTSPVNLAGISIPGQIHPL